MSRPFGLDAFLLACFQLAFTVSFYVHGSMHALSLHGFLLRDIIASCQRRPHIPSGFSDTFLGWGGLMTLQPDRRVR